MGIVTQVAEAMQRVFGTIADEAADQCGLIRRRRKFSGATLVQVLVLGFLRKPNASTADLATTASLIGLEVTPQAIEKRFTRPLVDTLQQVWQSMVQIVISSEPVAIPLLQRFSGVRIGDSTIIGLPEECADEFPGCGGRSGSGRSALKIQVTWNLLYGMLETWLQTGRESDLPTADPDGLPPRGSLSIYDLGYFCLQRFGAWSTAGAYWISRLQPGTLVFNLQGELLDLLAHVDQHQGPGPVDAWLLVGREEQLPCRLIALEVPAEVAARRRQKAREKAAKKGRTPSAQHLAWCGWTIYITNCDEQLLTWKELVVLYRARWQIELLFKLWKSHNLLAVRKEVSPLRQLAELFSKMIAVIMQHWLLLCSMGNRLRYSFRKAAARLQEWILPLTQALNDFDRLCQTLDHLLKAIEHLCHLDRRRKHPGTTQLLLNQELLNYTT
jgi:hypothetical protein